MGRDRLAVREGVSEELLTEGDQHERRLHLGALSEVGCSHVVGILRRSYTTCKASGSHWSALYGGVA